MVEHKILAELSSFMNHRRMAAEVNHSFRSRQTNIGWVINKPHTISGLPRPQQLKKVDWRLLSERWR